MKSNSDTEMSERQQAGIRAIHYLEILLGQTSQIDPENGKGTQVPLPFREWRLGKGAHDQSARVDVYPVNVPRAT